MHFVWDDLNTTHIARHGLTPSQVDDVLTAPDLGIGPAERGRVMLEGTIAPGLIRVVVEVLVMADGDLYPVTAYRLHPHRRRTQP